MKVSKKHKLLSVVLALYMSVLPSCAGNNPATSDETPPTLPSQETMQMSQEDLSLFLSGNMGAQADNQVLTKQNWGTAAVIVAVFNLAVFVGMVIPVAATAAALSHEPTLEADGKFHWKYAYANAINNLEVELIGQALPSVVNWEMYVTSTAPALNNYLWYDGQHQIDGKSGYWQFYDAANPNTQNNLVRIDWQHPSENEATLQFLNNKTDAPGFNDTLTYSVKDDSVSVEILDASNQNSTHIAWHRQTRQGYIIATNYNNGAKACWDSNLDDVVCTN